MATVARRQRPPSRARPLGPEWTGLIARGRGLLDEAAALIDDEAIAADGETVDFDAVVASLEAAVEALFEHIAEIPDESPRDDVRAACDLVSRIYGAQRDLREHGTRRRLDGLARVQEALTRLHAAPTMERLLEMVSSELCRACGFDRSVVFGVEGSELVPIGVHVEGDPESAAALFEVTNAKRVPLRSMVIETEMLRRRAPAIIHDAENDERTFKPLVEAYAVMSYVAAPIIFEGRVIGFAHGDCVFTQRPMDTIDRDLLWAFSEGFAWAVERATLTERIAAQRDHVRSMLRSTEAVLDEISDGGVAIITGGERSGTAAVRAAARMVAPDPELDALLTRREREVLALLGTGATNAQIATQLVIAEGTVKSHVKHVLRKLRVSNRAEAVSRYLTLMSGDGAAGL